MSQFILLSGDKLQRDNFLYLHCAFTKGDVEKGEVVAEYTGEVILVAEATEHKAEYARVGKTCTLMIIRHGGQSLA